jgi:hypothetical protein
MLFVLRRDHAGACGHDQHLIAVMGARARGAALAEAVPGEPVRTLASSAVDVAIARGRPGAARSSVPGSATKMANRGDAAMPRDKVATERVTKK